MPSPDHPFADDITGLLKEARQTALKDFKEIVFTYLRKQVTKGRVAEMIQEINKVLDESEK